MALLSCVCKVIRYVVLTMHMLKIRLGLQSAVLFFFLIFVVILKVTMFNFLFLDQTEQHVGNSGKTHQKVESNNGAEGVMNVY